ncbi:ATP-binding protein [Gracilimonas mengyeensis]|uniref:histidine kinase n=1 Tax=Gracilimonas mengyeensis TaxID=1302730 RepID=A0A521EDQ7_9BACT|nr:HAMP domain-containing sensor histidine kinase [Gracilimonas mengyeensis]SMO82048.1 His Kinase A (phospho-acceptor) domain-containing protein [Gracilimonas mengyeensis]
MDELKTFIADYPYPIFIIDGNTHRIHYANNFVESRSKASPVGKRVEKYLQLITSPLEKATYTQFDQAWYTLSEKEIDTTNRQYYLLELEKPTNLPDTATLDSWKKMIAVMLHRLRSPLTGINGYLDMLEDENENQNLNKRFKSINKGLTHIYDLMDELEVLYNIQPVQKKEEFTTTNIKEVVDEALLLVDEENRKRISVQGSLPDFTLDSLPVVTRRILSLLLTNALEHSSDQNIELTVSEDLGGRITIKNTLKNGIDQDIRDHVFYPFVTTKANNLGIGLTMALLYARQLGGTIFFEESTEEKTVVAQLKFPVA